MVLTDPNGEELELNNLTEFVEAIAAHQDEFPSHGTQCVCMDRFARAFRRAIKAGLPDKVPGILWDEDYFNKQSRIQYVVLMSMRNL